MTKNLKKVGICVLLLVISSLLFAQQVEIEVEKDSAEVEDSNVVVDIDSIVKIESDEDELVKIGVDVTVAPEDTIQGDVVAITSDLSVFGFVEGDAVCISGDLEITGTVLGDAVVISGDADIGSTAVIEGDLVCISGGLSKHENAKVEGEVVNLSLPFISPVLHHAFKFIKPGPARGIKPRFGPMGRRVMGLFVYLIKVIALVVFIFLIVLFFKKGMDRVADAIENSFWRSALAGFVGVIIIVPLTILLVVLIIGIPLIPLLWIAFLAALIFGFASITYTIGKIAAEKKNWKDRSPYMLALVGLVVIEIVPFLGNLTIIAGGPFSVIGSILKVLGFIISYVAWIIGFGGVILTRFGTCQFGK
jgi:hypothetical protein